MICNVKKNKRKFIIGLTVLFLALAGTSTVQAGTDIDWNNKLTYGRDIYYWVDSSNSYVNSISSAKSKLRYPSGMYNPIVLNSTSVKLNSKMDLYQYRSNDGNNASTSVFRKNSSGVYYNSTSQKDSYDWVYGNININDYTMSKYNTDLQSTIILHEMLHVYGCKDIENSASIMYGYTPSVRSLTSDANTVLNNKY